MPTPFSADDLGRIFDARALTRGRSLVLGQAVTLAIDGDTIGATVRDLGAIHTVSTTPSIFGKRVVFSSSCSCGRSACSHLAAAAFATLDTRPEWRKAQQQSFLSSLLSGAPAQTKKQLTFLIEPGDGTNVFFLTTVLEEERTGRFEMITAVRVVESVSGFTPDEQALCRLIGSDQARSGVPMMQPGLAARILDGAVQSRQARWKPTGKRLTPGPQRAFDAGKPPPLPPKSAILAAGTKHWYVDAVSGQCGAAVPRSAPARGNVASVGSARGRKAEPAARAAPPPARASSAPTEVAIVERPMTPWLRLIRVEGADETGAKQRTDALRLVFDYEGAHAEADDERQFVRIEEEPGRPVFVRRNRPGEQNVLETLRQDGFAQIRVQSAGDSKGQRLHVFRGPDAPERWHRFVTERLPSLEAMGWRAEIDERFGPKMVEATGIIEARVSDGESGWFSLELGIEVDGERLPLLPILSRILAQGGMANATIVDGKIQAALPDGRMVSLPADRIGRMLATMADLIEAAERTANGALLLPESEVPALLDLEDLLTTRWHNAAAIRAYAERFRDEFVIEPVDLPAAFTAELRVYQKQGLDWLQHLRAHNLAGILADDMGLGKTAQTIAHIMVEAVAGRLDMPALIVLPTSLVANWSAELAKFAPSLRFIVHHGIDRHAGWDKLSNTDVVITTYSVMTRDIEILKNMVWHLVVLDESQAIKSPDSKTTRAVCALQARHKLCLSGTPIENNLQELWSQFAFLMPGLLGDRKSFTKRFRTPIEKRQDDTRRVQLVRRIRPFILRRTKSEVATELPPKYTIVRRVSLAPEQRELYETIRVTLYEKLRVDIAEKSLARSRIVLLDALLKLRQVCCDPRLVKLPAAREIGVSSKLEDLLQMVGEMVAEGRKILLFSQFTSMLDLMKPEFDAAGIPFVELRGDTLDRKTPVDRFEAGEVPLFLISLKAGGRGLNLTAADTVIHYDPWWNPAVEEQASDRAHRIGQTKSVFVYKLIAAGTVEERIVDLQQRKSALAEIALGGDSDLPGLDLDDVDFLFAPDVDQVA